MQAIREKTHADRRGNLLHKCTIDRPMGCVNGRAGSAVNIGGPPPPTFTERVHPRSKEARVTKRYKIPSTHHAAVPLVPARSGATFGAISGADSVRIHACRYEAVFGKSMEYKDLRTSTNQTDRAGGFIKRVL